MFPHVISFPSVNHILTTKQRTNTTWCRFYLVRSLSYELLRQLCQAGFTVNIVNALAYTTLSKTSRIERKYVL